MFFIVSGGCPRCLFLAPIAGSLTRSFQPGQPRHRQGSKTVIVEERERPPHPIFVHLSVAGTLPCFENLPLPILLLSVVAGKGFDLL